MIDQDKSKEQLIQELAELRQQLTKVEEIVATSHQTEAMLRADKEFGEAILNASIDTIFIYDISAEKAYRWNQAFTEISGYSDAEIPTLQAPHAFYNSEDLARVTEALDRVQSEGRVVIELPLLTKEGQQVPFEYTATIINNEQGQPCFVLAIGRDITHRKQVEHALHESEDRYRITSELTSDYSYAFRVEPDGTLTHLWVTGALMRITGWTAAELHERGGWESLIYPDDMNIPMSQFKALMAGESSTIEYRIVAKDGEIRWMRDYARSRYDAEQQRTTHIFGAVQDINEQKLQEEALRQSETRYRAIVETAQEGVWLIDAEGSTTYVNPKMAELIGYTPKEMLGCSLYDFMDDAAQQEAQHNMERRSQGITEHHEFRLKHKEGHDVWTIMATNPIMDNTGQFLAALAMVTDVTQQKKDREALRQSEKKYRHLVEEAPDGIMVIDLNGRIQSVNDRLCTQLGYSNAELEQMAIRDIHSTGQPSGSLPDMSDLIKAGKLTAEWRYQRKDGSCFDAEVSAGILDNIVLAFVRDITERKQAEEEIRQLNEDLERRVIERTRELAEANEHLQELSRLKDEFVSNVSHELRTPVTSLKLYHDLLQANPDKTDTYLKTLKRETNRLSHTIESLLALSRMDQGEFKLNPTMADLNELVSSYMADRQLLVESKGLTLTFQPELTLSEVYVDAGLIGQVFSILLTNAINYTPAGGQLHISTHLKAERQGGWAGFSVRDTGPGISTEEQAQLFERFYRGEAGKKSGTPGTGLGLALVRQIVELHHGRIEVESEGIPGKGSTFTVWHPVGK